MNSRRSRGDTVTPSDLIVDVLRGRERPWPEQDRIPAFSNEFLACARRHGVESLLVHLLSEAACWGTYPPDVRRSLQTSAKREAAFEIVRRRDLLGLSEAFSAEGLTVMLLKGAGLAYTHYPVAYLRRRADTDLLIDPNQISPVKRLFERLGYRQSGMVYKSHQFTCFRPAYGSSGPISYDVHWRVTNRAEFARIISYRDAERASVPIEALPSCRTLAPAHSLLLACAHRWRNPHHVPDRLIWLYDIHLLASRMTAAEAQDFAEQAVAAGAQAACLDGIDRAADSLFTPFPGDARATLESAPSRRKRFRASSLGLMARDFKDLPDLKTRIGMVREFVLPGGDYLLQRYHKERCGWVPLLYLRYWLSGLFNRLALR